MRALALSMSMLCAVTLAACPDEVDSSSSGAGGGQGEPTWGESACGACVIDACSAERDACAADPGCAGHLDCVLGCPLAVDDIDPACLDACPAPESGAGLSALNDFHGCRSNAGCEVCGGGSGGGHPILEQDCRPSPSPDACVRCEADNCCETTCDDACQALFDCAEPCPTDACIDQCFADHPDGVASVGAWQGCMGVFCRDDCPWVTSNSCFDCGMEHCAEHFVDCFAAPDCYLHFQCSQRCDFGDVDCENACDALHPRGSMMWSAFIYCVAGHCVTGECPTGPEGP
jgi:hypothetical protein